LKKKKIQSTTHICSQNLAIYSRFKRKKHTHDHNKKIIIIIAVSQQL